MLKTLTVLALLLLPLPALAQPQIQPSTVKVAGSPNVLAWPVTTRISRIEIADQGVRVTFDKCATWPDVTPPGWGGPLRFTLWLFENIGGEWYGAGIIQFWACDQFNGGAVYQDNQIARNWVYDSRWSAMVGHQPQPGERIGFMVSAGNARGQDDHLTAERSDIVEVLMPASATAYPPFAAVEGGYVPPPVYVPPTAPPAPPTGPVVVLPSTDLSPVLNQQQVDHLLLVNIQAQIEAGRREVQEFREAVRSKWVAIMDSPIVKYGLAAIAGWFTTRLVKQ